MEQNYQRRRKGWTTKTRVINWLKWLSLVHFCTTNSTKRKKWSNGETLGLMALSRSHGDCWATWRDLKQKVSELMVSAQDLRVLRPYKPFGLGVWSHFSWAPYPFRGPGEGIHMAPLPSPICIPSPGKGSVHPWMRPAHLRLKTPKINPGEPGDICCSLFGEMWEL